MIPVTLVAFYLERACKHSRVQYHSLARYRGAAMHKAFVSLIVALVAFLTPTSSRAQNVLFIIDFSGSMNEKAGDRSKVDIAKEVFRNTVRELPPTTKVGLMLYGHRRAKDCRDIELVADLGKQSAQSLADRVDKTQAKGETPIAAALLQSVPVFLGREGQNNSIVLITDGREECNGDPCSAAELLGTVGLDVKAHVVGFRLTATQRAAVECISKISGGRYFDAQNAGALKSALAQVRETVVQAPPPPPPQTVVQAPPPAPPPPPSKPER